MEDTIKIDFSGNNANDFIKKPTIQSKASSKMDFKVDKQAIAGMAVNMMSKKMKRQLVVTSAITIWLILSGIYTNIKFIINLF